MILDEYSRRSLTEQDIVDIVYRNPEVDLAQFRLDNCEKHNTAVKHNYSDLCLLSELEEIAVSPAEWHRQNQSQWHMPKEYQTMDIAAWVLAECSGEAEIQRAGEELLEYAERNLLDMLCYLKYLVDTMRENNVVWGVGRGSSVASFVLYKIGVHRINSLYYDLDFHEFMR
jgi:DNA polymerase III alpha subunit